MKKKINILIPILFLLGGCVTQFVPEVDETRQLLVVEGTVTNNPGPYLIKISKSFPLGQKSASQAVTGCIVTITDDLGGSYSLTPASAGNYYTLPDFRGIIGRKYSLHIQTPDRLTYESYPMELKAVPPVDSIYYQKLTLVKPEAYTTGAEGAQIYLSTHDPVNACRYYRWDFAETWEIRLPFSRPVNKVCWINEQSSDIFIKSTTALTEDIIIHYPIKFVDNNTDRLKFRYSILVNQYSLSPEEYLYWEKLRAVTQNVGGLYDVIPAAIPNNLYCIEKPSEKVLGYFSVSGKASMRKFIREGFRGVINMYSDCISDTIHTMIPPSGVNQYVWVLESEAGPCLICPYQVLTTIRGCADCTVRGSNIKPPYWP